MIRKRRVVVIGALVAGLFEACSFPDVQFRDSTTEGGAPADATISDALFEAGKELDGGRTRPADVDPEAGARDAATRGDAGIARPEAGVDAGPVGCAGAGGNACDCDKDDSLNGGPGCVPEPPSKADCDDFDPLVYPEQDFVAADWDPRSPHVPANDWNCDGKVTKQFDYGIQCTLSDCTEGFAEDIPCNAQGTYNICKPSLNVLGLLTLCSVGRTEQRTQGCR